MVLIPEIVASFLLKVAEKGLGYFQKHGLPVPKRQHRKFLSGTLRKMPFVYKDLALDVVTDFVAIRLRGVDPNTNKSRPDLPGETPQLFEKMRDFKRIVLVGEAGIGKTTLCRFAIQSIFGVTGVEPPAHVGETLLPFYVPLKAVDNHAPYPIQRYLLSNYPYLAGNRGQKRILKLARLSQLSLFLDGYDEASYSGGSEFLSRELTLLLGDKSAFAANSPQSGDDSELYRGLRECRIWLTSRAEFLQANPVVFGKDVVRLEARGIQTHRERLAKNIFNFHLRRGDHGADTLNSELFIIQLDEVGDESLKKISHNPLFLTVLCYLYANASRQDKPPKQVLRSGFYELISECVKLLIIDIDRQKSLDLPESDREPMLARRGYYPEEKLAFLQYLAAQSYLQSRNVLEATWVLGIAKAFFAGISTSASAADIERNLGTGNPSVDLIRQLVLSDIFSSVERVGQDPIYDFPHRRFREVLASEYWSSASGSEILSERVSDNAFSELITTYVDFSSYGKRILEKIVAHIERNTETYRHGEILNTCIASYKITAEERDTLYARFLRGVIRNDKAALPRSLLVWCDKHSISHWEIVRQLFEEATTSRDRRKLSIAISLMNQSFPERVADLLEGYWVEANRTAPIELDDFSYDMIVATVQNGLQPLPQILEATWPNPTRSDITTRAFARFLTSTYRQTTVSQYREAILKVIQAHFKEADARISQWILLSDSGSEKLDFPDGISREPIPVVVGAIAPQVWM